MENLNKPDVPINNTQCRNEIMMYGMKPQVRRTAHIPEYIKYDNLFSPPECQAIIDFGHKSNGFGFASVGTNEPGGYNVDKNYRMVKTVNIRPEDGFDWLYTRLMQRIVWTNNERFEFDISGLNEYIQLLWYQSKEQTAEGIAGHYKWHQDIGTYDMSLRKLSIVVQLSKSEDYDGCNLTLQTHRQFEIPERKQGDVIIFPSYLPHMVTPITRGERYSLVLWVSGPPFR